MEAPDSPGNDSSALGTTRRGLLVGLTTGAGALGLGAAAMARGSPERAGNDEGVGNDDAAGNDEKVGQGRGPPDRHIVGTTTRRGTRPRPWVMQSSTGAA